MKANCLYRRKSGHGFILRNSNVSLSKIKNNDKEYDIMKYFEHLPSYQLQQLNTLLQIMNEIKVYVIIKLIGSGIASQLDIVTGCLARFLKNAMNTESTSQSIKDTITPIYELVCALSKSDTRIVERKKIGHTKARKSPPCNKR